MRRVGDACDGHKIPDEIEIELFIEGRVNRVGRRGEEQRIAVRRRMGDCLCCDVGTTARSVLDKELLAEPLRQPSSYQPRHDVGYTAGSKSDHDTDRSCGIDLRSRNL